MGPKYEIFSPVLVGLLLDSSSKSLEVEKLQKVLSVVVVVQNWTALELVGVERILPVTESIP